MGQVLRQYQALDKRIRVCSLEKNLELPRIRMRHLPWRRGDFVGLLDHDDLLAPDALYEVAKAVTEFEDTDVVYTDEDKVTTDLDRTFSASLQTGFQHRPAALNNYITHFCGEKDDRGRSWGISKRI